MTIKTYPSILSAPFNFRTNEIVKAVIFHRTFLPMAAVISLSRNHPLPSYLTGVGWPSVVPVLGSWDPNWISTRHLPQGRADGGNGA